MTVVVQGEKQATLKRPYRPNGRIRKGSSGVIVKDAAHEQAAYSTQPSPPYRTDLGDVSPIKELISLHFSGDSLSAKVTSIDGAFPNETD